MTNQSTGGLPLARVAAELFVLHDKWWSLHGKIWSLRSLIPVPTLGRKVDNVEAVRELRHLRESLDSLPELADSGAPRDSVAKLQDYRLALASSLRLLQEIFELAHEKISTGQWSAEKRKRKVSWYRKVAKLTRILRQDAEELEE